MDKIRNEYIRLSSLKTKFEREARLRWEKRRTTDSWVYQRKMKVSTCAAVRNVTAGGWWACMVADWRQLRWSRGKTAVMLMLMHSHTLYFEIRSYKHDIHGNLPGSNETKNVNLVNSVAIFSTLSLCVKVFVSICMLEKCSVKSTVTEPTRWWHGHGNGRYGLEHDVVHHGLINLGFLCQHQLHHVKQYQTYTVAIHDISSAVTHPLWWLFCRAGLKEKNPRKLQLPCHGVLR